MRLVRGFMRRVNSEASEKTSARKYSTFKAYNWPKNEEWSYWAFELKKIEVYRHFMMQYAVLATLASLNQANVSYKVEQKIKKLAKHCL